MVRNVVLKIINVVIVYSAAVSIVVGTAPTVNIETHSLTYIYTALSKPVGLPGIHQFSAMGLLDGRMIDYFDSEHQQKVPKQDWMEERLDPDYWVKGTQSYLDDQLWFKVSLDILMKRMGHKDSDLHVLQWMRGCEGNMQPDGNITFHRGKNIYTYDGNDFLSFDDTNKVWVAATEAANETKKEWNNLILIGYRLYLENECMKSLRKFVDYQRTHLQNAPPPEVFMFSKDTNNDKKVMLTCLATGFYPKDVTLNIKRNGRVLTKEDGVVTSGVRPNDDDTFQRRDSVEILRRDTSTFTCEVNHPASRLHVEKKWDHKLPPGPEGLGPIIGVFVGLLLLVAVCVLLAVLYNKGKSGLGAKSEKGEKGSTSSLSSGASGGSGSSDDPQKTCCGQDCRPNMAAMFHLSDPQGTFSCCAGTQDSGRGRAKGDPYPLIQAPRCYKHGSESSLSSDASGGSGSSGAPLLPPAAPPASGLTNDDTDG